MANEKATPLWQFLIVVRIEKCRPITARRKAKIEPKTSRPTLSSGSKGTKGIKTVAGAVQAAKLYIFHVSQGDRPEAPDDMLGLVITRFEAEPGEKLGPARGGVRPATSGRKRRGGTGVWLRYVDMSGHVFELDPESRKIGNETT